MDNYANKKNSNDKYDFYIEYYLHYAIGTKYENFVKISKEEYIELNEKINNSEESMVKTFAIYEVGFYTDSSTYVRKQVTYEVFCCLFLSQRYEKNKNINERKRYLDKFFNQDNMNNLIYDYDLENEILNKNEEREIKLYLDSILSHKQSERFFKNKIKGVSIVNIANCENTTEAAIRESVKTAKIKIKKIFLKKF